MHVANWSSKVLTCTLYSTRLALSPQTKNSLIFLTSITVHELASSQKSELAKHYSGSLTFNPWDSSLIMLMLSAFRAFGLFSRSEAMPPPGSVLYRTSYEREQYNAWCTSRALYDFWPLVCERHATLLEFETYSKSFPMVTYVSTVPPPVHMRLPSTCQLQGYHSRLLASRPLIL